MVGLGNLLHSDSAIAGCSLACPLKEVISCLPTESVIILSDILSGLKLLHLAIT